MPPPPSNSKVKSVSAKVRTDSETDGLGRSIGESKLPRLEVKCLHGFVDDSMFFPDVEFPVHPQFALQAGLAGKAPQVKLPHI